MAFNLRLTVIMLGLSLAILLVVKPMFEDPPVPRIEEPWWGAGKPGENVDSTIRMFKINVSEEVLYYLKVRLSTNVPLQASLEGAKQHYGIHSDLVAYILEYWKKEYNWREREKFLNQYPQFMVNVQGLNIHYMHVKPAAKHAKKFRVLPLLLLHGWPETFTIFYDIIPYLTTPQKGRNFVFEVIAPSLPGYGYSEAAARPGLGAIQMATVMKNLMEMLGIKRYYVQGNDWGSAIAQVSAVLYPNKLLGVHSTMCFSIAPISFFKLLVFSWYPSWIVDESHQGLVYPLSKLLSNTVLETGYLHLQSTKPDTVGVALRDSPIGLAAYIIEKFITLTNPAWKDTKSGGIGKFNMKRLLDNVMIYWLTASITTSMRLYAETFNDTHMGKRFDRIPITEVPTGCARFHRDLWYMPESILRDKYTTLVHLKDYNTGHFSALEVPDVLSRDIFDFVETVEKLD